MNTDFIITKGKITIRPMKIEDVSSYIEQFNLNEKSKIESIAKCETILEYDLQHGRINDFTIEYENNIIGAVVTQATGDYLCDGIVMIDIPNKKYKYLSIRVKDLFVKLLRKTYLYDDIVFSIPCDVSKINISNLRKIPIACWKTRTTSV